MKLAVLSVSNSALVELAYAVRKITAEYPGLLSVYAFNASKEIGAKQAEEAKVINQADFVILDLMGATREWEQIALNSCRYNSNVMVIGGDKEEISGLLRLGTMSADDLKQGARYFGGQVSQSAPNMTGAMAKMLPPKKFKDIQNYIKILKYWKNADEGNFCNLMYLIGRCYCGVDIFPEPQEPVSMDTTKILDPAANRYYDSVTEYRNVVGYDDQKPTIAVLFYGHSYPNRTRGCVAAFIQKLTPFANVLPVAFSRAGSRELEILRDILTDQAGSGRPDLIVNFLAFRMGAGPMGGTAQDAVKLLEKLDVPVVHPFFMSRREKEEWEASLQGINSAEFLIQVMLPELDGCIETIPVGALGVKKYNHDLRLELNELRLIDERADKAVARIKGWLNLRRKPNQDKKVAIICYNYPPGEDNIFGGAFLDTFASVERILALLHDNGYKTKKVSAEELRKVFTAGKLVNSGKWAGDTADIPFIRYDKEQYCRRLGNTAWRSQIESIWGTAPGSIMSENDQFLIPGWLLGNVFVGLQPSRGFHEQPDKFYHDKSLPPHHQYIAFYQWLKEEFKADAIIHVGTHGTLEFLSGKECGMSGDCIPDYLVYDIPHLYIYYAGNPAEAMIAKRRSHAVLVSYQPPSFTESELYGELAEIESLLNQRQQALALQNKQDELEEAIRVKAQSSNLPSEDWHELEQELFRIKRSLIPQGLHIFGRGFGDEEAAAFMKFLLRYDRGGLPSLQRLLAEARDLDYDDLLESGRIDILKELDEEAGIVVAKYLESKFTPPLIIEKGLSQTWENVMEYGLKAYWASINCQEAEGLIRVLDGRYQPVRLAGDMVRNPEVLPSGYNLYQFDTSQVPSESAMARGAKIAQNTIAQYIRNHGRYPKSIAVILWGLETSRTQGETVGQILYYLGIKKAAKKNRFGTRYEIIPAEELGRPRIDVVVNFCGFFRDMFPLLINELNDLLQQVACLDEDDSTNFIKANSAVVYNKLLAEGYESDEARELSTARLFGPAEAEYGSKVSKLIEIKTWTDETELGMAYINSLKHVYSKNYRGRAADDLFTGHLASVDIVSQVRSNHEYEVTDLDHYYEYFGGLAKSVEMTKGDKVSIYITDTTAEKIYTETVDKSIARGVRTRLFNPKWIEAMLEHSYHGVQKINDRFENILGLAATTNQVPEWVFGDMYRVYVADQDMRRRLTANNRWAYYNMLERMLELNKRGYWKATDEEIDTLRKTFLELEGELEED